jgi:hypothetical protein
MLFVSCGRLIYGGIRIDFSTPAELIRGARLLPTVRADIARWE